MVFICMEFLHSNRKLLIGVRDKHKGQGRFFGLEASPTGITQNSYICKVPCKFQHGLLRDTAQSYSKSSMHFVKFCCKYIMES